MAEHPRIYRSGTNLVSLKFDTVKLCSWTFYLVRGCYGFNSILLSVVFVFVFWFWQKREVCSHPFCEGPRVFIMSQITGKGSGSVNFLEINIEDEPFYFCFCGYNTHWHLDWCISTGMTVIKKYWKSCSLLVQEVQALLLILHFYGAYFWLLGFPEVWEVGKEGAHTYSPKISPGDVSPNISIHGVLVRLESLQSDINDWWSSNCVSWIQQVWLLARHPTSFPEIFLFWTASLA